MMATVANQRPHPREFILYRWWDNQGRLLYVGRSVSLFNRVSQHRRSSAFFAEAAAMTIERLDSAEQLAGAEMKAIRTENPLFNIVGGRHASDAKARRLIVSDLDPTFAGHWEPIEYFGISYGDLIRWAFKHSPTEVVGQGIVDDDDVDEDGDHEWFLYTIDAEEIVLDEFIAGLCEIRRWVHTPGDSVMEAYKSAAVHGLAGGSADAG